MTRGARRTEETDRTRLEALASGLESALGPDLLSVVLYGSAARGDRADESADLNVLVVLREIDLQAIERGAALNQGWVASGNPPLLFFSPWWIRHSCDVFPLEFQEILDSRRILLGPDPFAGLVINLDDLRHQCEREVKTRLIHLRTAWLEFQGDPDRLARVMAAGYSPLAALCRGVLRVVGETPPPESARAIERVAALCGLDIAPLRELEAVKRSGPGAASAAPRLLFQNYYRQMELLARAIDAGLTGRANR